MNSKQTTTAEWLKQQAEKSFNEIPTNVESRTLTMDTTESDCTDLAFLHIHARANENTGMLFITDRSLAICIGPYGGIRSAQYFGRDQSKTKTTYYVRRGIFSL